MNNLQPLKWVDHTTVDYIDHRAQGAGVLYRVCHFADKFRVYWVDSMGGSDGNKEFDSLDELKHWVDTDHYPHKMQPYVKPDMIGAYFDKFTQWGLDRGIIQNGNGLAQGLKLVSEMGELTDNLAKGRCIKDDIGDMMVVLNMLANMTGVKVEDCLAQAWGDIKDRKGYMNEHGVFIKDGDSEVTK
ncbi:hypothetical protein PSYG_00008 [Psychrobacter phage pOW20-A]|uniref:MazG-like pyrophosphatase n=1 Tax=Psychrobacter phage pOW20-A TaxID=754048 RepID=UPI0002C18B5C|nr:MazG-like pyrophosphatase [Psychrobacter phage pOW20-A]AGH57469.1 hypothetical protein PSYG_00008 [Psychrobacter phage pOW20-A]